MDNVKVIIGLFVNFQPLCIKTKNFHFYAVHKNFNFLKRAFCSSTIEDKPHTASDGHLYNPTSLKAKRKVKNITVPYLLFADNAELVAQSAQDLPTLLSQFSSACLTISLEKAKVLRKGTDIQPKININDKYIGNVKTLYTFTQVLRQTHQWTMNIDINCRIGKT